jgi:hypothetical protein
MTVESKPLVTPRRGLVAPLNRTHLDRAGPWLRLMIGLALIAYTGYTTVRGVAGDFAPLLQGAIAGVPLTLIGGLGAAVFLSVGQWLTAGRHTIVYAVLLILDARYTQRQIGPAVAALAAFHLPRVDNTIVSVVSFLASWGVSLLAARYGELLLFGKRKQE